MRRLLVLMSTVMFTVLSVHAQRMVSGKVIEQDTQDAVIQATASILSGDKVVSNGVTNTDGAFRVKAPSDGTYTLKITYVGFKTYTKKERTSMQAPSRSRLMPLCLRAPLLQPVHQR